MSDNHGKLAAVQQAWERYVNKVQKIRQERLAIFKHEDQRYTDQELSKLREQLQ